MAQRSGIPPWHMWGNTQTIVAPIQSSAVASRGSTPGQLVRINYARPETWHWLFSAKLLQGPNADVGSVFTQVEVAFDLTVGIGRSAVSIDGGSGGVGPGNLLQGGKSFENFFFEWGNGGAILFPLGAQLWTTQVLAPNRNFRSNAPFPNQSGFPVPGDFVTGPAVIDQITAQDIQCNCRVIALTGPASINIGQTVSVEVSAMFAPKTHIRPEWHNKSFPGAEDGGGTGTVAQQVDKLNYPGTPIRHT